MDVDVCDIVSGVIDAVLHINGSNVICKFTFEEEVRVIGKHPDQNKNFSKHQLFDLGLPYGHANGPGMESECKNLENSKYCHNYYSLYFDVTDGHFSESKCIGF